MKLIYWAALSLFLSFVKIIQVLSFFPAFIDPIAFKLFTFVLIISYSFTIRSVVLFFINKERSELIKLNLYYFVKSIISVITYMSIFSGLFFVFRDQLSLDSSMILSLILIVVTFSALFFNRDKIRKSAKKYLKRFDIQGKRFYLLDINFKLLLSTSFIRVFIDIVTNILKVDKGSNQLYITYILFVLDFAVILFISLVFRVIFDILSFSFSNKIKQSENEMVKNYLFIIPLISNLGRFFTFLLFFMLSINLLGYTPKSFMSSMSSLIQSVSILGAGLSFAARDNIANFISGMFILTDTPFNIGDRIRVGDVYGDIEEIGIRTTTVKTLENALVLVPNSIFTNNSLINYRKNSSFVSIRYPINISSKASIDKVKEILYEIINSCSDIMKVPSYRIYVVSYDPFISKLMLVFWIRDISKEFIAKDFLNSEIIKAFNENNIPMPYPKYKFIETSESE